MAAPQKVSFTVRRPSPVSRATSSGPDSDTPSFKYPPLPRHLTQSTEFTPSGSPLARSETDSRYVNGSGDSSDEDDQVQDELVTGFDRFGVQRLNEGQNKGKQEPLVIPALKNRDWRELARKRRSAHQYVPHSANTQTGADGSVGGLGTRDVVGSGPVLSGLHTHSKVVKAEGEEDIVRREEIVEDVKMEEVKKEVEVSEDEIARRAILAEASGVASDTLILDAIPIPLSEGEAYKQDIEELPEVASLEAYTRVPIEQFGAAMLRGMGWKEGTAASKNGKGLVRPYLPTARPALLGIGAKEMEVFDDGSKKKRPSRPERKYVPVIKRERGREETPGSGRERSHSPRYSRRNSPSTNGGGGYNELRKGSDRDRKRDRDREGDYRERERGKDKYGDRDERDDYRHEKDRRRDYNKDRSSRGDGSRDSSKRRDY